MAAQPPTNGRVRVPAGQTARTRLPSDAHHEVVEEGTVELLLALAHASVAQGGGARSTGASGYWQQYHLRDFRTEHLGKLGQQLRESDVGSLGSLEQVAARV